MKGLEAMGEAAIRAGCRYFFGYPITPQSELPEYLARRLPEVGGVFLQAESEVAAINMVYGAAGAGGRVMTSSSSPGVSLKQEGISYIAGAELPCVIVNMMRGGPGLGNIAPAQSDYFQATRGGGHGDYRLIVLAPSSVQELADLVFEAFDLAERYRNPVMVLGDGLLGQMMEPVVLPPEKPFERPHRPWATTGAKGRPPNLVNSIYLDPVVLEEHNLRLAEKYRTIEAKEQRAVVEDPEGDSRLFLVAYGTAARISRAAMRALRRQGIPVGLIRPVTLWPFPKTAFESVMDRALGFLAVELSLGQMVEDVRLAVEGRRPVEFYGRTAGMLPEPESIAKRLEAMHQQLGADVAAQGRR
ncbi:MAG: 3-methyl-2-oxobutanoate dehydrogenase subunit VorB [Bacillota bacterium]